MASRCPSCFPFLFFHPSSFRVVGDSASLGPRKFMAPVFWVLTERNGGFLFLILSFSFFLYLLIDFFALWVSISFPWVEESLLYLYFRF